MAVNGDKIKVILVEDPKAGRFQRRRLLRVADRIARLLAVPLRVLTPALDRLPSGASWLGGKGVPHRSEWIVLGNGRTYTGSVISEVERMKLGLLVLGISPLERDRGALELWKTKVLEASVLPVLMLPSSRGLTDLSFRSFFVPMSGEARGNAALDWAIRWGNVLRVPVDVFHVTERHERCGCDHSIVGHVSDEFHHEYPKLVEEFVSEASPYTSNKEKLVIREFLHCAGDPVLLLSQQVRKRRGGLLVLEWKGHLEAGRAPLIKFFLGRGDIPFLLVRQPSRGRSRLKVGDEFNAA